ncbi:hypothetical protein [Gordonia sp. SID5947]|uniref:hypothetical protein n=1 Tax=Gordonia sp. SID5947 TaxID=2690315 RepID=UPI001F2B383B|nr:hypothetical protein [Gordonia sp. SID5947]
MTGLLVIGAVAVESSEQADTEPSVSAAPATTIASCRNFLVIVTSSSRPGSGFDGDPSTPTAPTLT